MDPFDITRFNCVKDWIEEHTWHASWALLNTFQGLDLTSAKMISRLSHEINFSPILSLLQIYNISKDNWLYTSKFLINVTLTLTLTFPFSSSTIFSNFRSRWTTPFCKETYKNILLFWVFNFKSISCVNKIFSILYMCRYIIQYVIFFSWHYCLFKYYVLIFHTLPQLFFFIEYWLN